MSIKEQCEFIAHDVTERIDMDCVKKYIDALNKEAYLKTCRFYELDLEKINSIDDCKKILKFLCDLTLEPTPKDVSYNGFEEVEQYFK